MGLFSRDRYFVVIGDLCCPRRHKLLPGKVSVTLTARNHDDAERQACREFRIGDEMGPERWLRVEEVREIRRR
jgi:hypothetical protein